MSSSLFKPGTQVNVKLCRKRGEANHTDTSPPYLHELPYAKIIEFCVDPAVSSIKFFFKKIWLYSMQFCLEL